MHLRILFACCFFVPILAGCGGVRRDASRITVVNAMVTEPHRYPNKLGGDVGDQNNPDKFDLFLIVSTPRNAPRFKPGDTFLAALAVGTVSEPSKYGAQSGLEFEITGKIIVTGAGGNVPPNFAGWPPQFFYDAKLKRSEQIFCTPQNELRWTATPGDGTDTLRFRVSTAAMSGLRPPANAIFAIYDTYYVPPGLDQREFTCRVEEFGTPRVEEFGTPRVEEVGTPGEK